MAELRHSTSMGTRASSSPAKRDEDALPFVPEIADDRKPVPPLFFLLKDKDLYVKIVLSVLLFLLLAALVAIPSVWKRLVCVLLKLLMNCLCG